jgi:hypothetical protein
MSSKMKAAVAKAGDEIVEELADAAVAITKEAIVAGKGIAVEAVKDGKEIALAGMKELKEEIKEHFNNEPESGEEGVVPGNVSVGLAEITVTTGLQTLHSVEPLALVTPHIALKLSPNVSISPELVALGAEAPAPAPAPAPVPEEPSKPDF